MLYLMRMEILSANIFWANKQAKAKLTSEMARSYLNIIGEVRIHAAQLSHMDSPTTQTRLKSDKCSRRLPSLNNGWEL